MLSDPGTACSTVIYEGTLDDLIDGPGAFEDGMKAGRNNVARLLLAKAKECSDEAKRLGMPEGSTQHMCANVWRAASALADPEAVPDDQR